MGQIQKYRDLALEHGYNIMFVRRVIEVFDEIIRKEATTGFVFLKQRSALHKAHDQVDEEWKGMILEGIVLD